MKNFSLLTFLLLVNWVHAQVITSGIEVENTNGQTIIKGQFRTETVDGKAHTWLPWENGEIYLTGNKDGSGEGDVNFRTYSDAEGYLDIMVVKGNGNVGIGTASPDSKLTVKGNIHTEEITIDLSVPAPDYVFTKDYDLLTIEEVQQHIKEKGHLPNIPSAKEMETHGVALGIMNMKLLEKIEELTLYVIEQHKEVNTLRKKVEQLENK